MSSDVVSDEDSDDSPPSPPSSAREKTKQYKKQESRKFQLSHVDKDHLKVSDEKTNKSSPFAGQEQSKSVYNLNNREVQISDSKNKFPSASVPEKIKPIPKLRKNPPKKRNMSDIQISEEDTAISHFPSVREEIKPIKSLDSGKIIVSDLNSDKSHSSSVDEKSRLFHTRDTHQGSERDGLPPSLVSKDMEIIEIADEDSVDSPSLSFRKEVRPLKNRDGSQAPISDENMDESSSLLVQDKKRNSPIQISNEGSIVHEDRNSSIQEDINPSNKTDDSQIQVSEKIQNVSTVSSVREKIESFNNPESSEFQVPPTQDTESAQITDLRVILIGKTGTGKSSSANTILGGDYFLTSSSGSSVTERCSSECAKRFGRKIQVIDTPGLFETSFSEEQTEEEIMKCIAMSAPGPHAFILVLNISRFTKEEKETALRFFELFENAVYYYFIVLFTRLDDLEYEGKTLAEHLQSVPENLESILRKCHGRYIAFNNRETGAKKDQQVQQLLEIIDKNTLARETKYYTDEMFQEAERLLKAKEEEMRRILEHQKEQKYEGLRREIEAKYKNQQENIRSRLEIIDGHYRKIEDSIASKKTEIAEFIKKMKEEKVMIEKKAKEFEQRKKTELQELQNNQIEDKVPEESLRVSVLQSFKDEGTKLSNFIKSSQTVSSMRKYLSKFFKRS